jgi:hypothetical protein
MYSVRVLAAVVEGQVEGQAEEQVLELALRGAEPPAVWGRRAAVSALALRPESAARQ